MSKDPKISNIQVRALLISTIIGIGILSLPSQLANAVGKDGWIPLVLSGLIIIPIVVLISKLFEDNPGKTFFEIGNEILGKPIFKICLIIYLLYYLAVMAYIVRLLGDLIKGFLLTNTPMSIIMFLFILAVSYVSISEIDVIARVAYLFYPVVLGFGIILVLLSIPAADITNILPVFQSDISSMLEGLNVAVFSFAGFEILLFSIPYAEDKKRITKTSISAIIIITIFYLVIYLTMLTQFSLQHLKSDPYPLLMAARLIDLPGYFLQNLDGLVLAIWVGVIFSTMAPLFYSSGKVLSKIFNAESHQNFILILIPIIFVAALLPRSIFEMNEIVDVVVNYLTTIIGLVIPLVLFIVGRIRRRAKQ